MSKGKVIGVKENIVTIEFLGNEKPSVYNVLASTDSSHSRFLVIKSFDKKDRPALIQSYEKLIAHLVREINNSRQ